MSLESEFYGWDRSMRTLPATSIRELYGNTMPVQRGREDQLRYGNFASEPIQSFVPAPNEYLVIAPPVDGEALHALMYFAAPSKRYGIDTDDLFDWRDLYKEENADLLTAHRKIPGWNEFEKYKDRLWGQLMLDKSHPSVMKSRPVVHIKRTSRGKLEWDMNDLDPALTETINQTVLHDGTGAHPLFPVLGPLFVAAYSPHITDKWPHMLGFDLKDTNDGPTNDMGATQAVALALAMADKLLPTELISRMVDYCERG